MRRTEAASEAAVLPWTVEMIVGIGAAGIVTYPLITGIDVRDIGMAGLVTVIALDLLLAHIVGLVGRRRFGGTVKWSRPVRRRGHGRPSVLLCKRRNTYNKQCSQNELCCGMMFLLFSLFGSGRQLGMTASSLILNFTRV